MRVLLVTFFTVLSFLTATVNNAPAAMTPAQTMCQLFAGEFNVLAAKHKSPLVVIEVLAKRYEKNLTWCSALIVSQQTGAAACYVVLVDLSGKIWNSQQGKVPKVDCAHPWRKLKPIA